MKRTIRLCGALVLLVSLVRPGFADDLYDSDVPDLTNSPPNGGPYDGIVQNTGQALRWLGSQVTLDTGPVPGRMQLAGARITQISVPTQTFGSSGTQAYAPEFLELRLYYNDSAISDDANNDPFVEGSPTGNRVPGTLIASSRVANPAYDPNDIYPDAPVYPSRGTHRFQYTNGTGHVDGKNMEDFVVHFLFNDADQGHDPNGTLVLANQSYGPTAGTNGEGAANQSINPGVSFTWVISNLDANGEPDGHDTTANSWGIFVDNTGPVIGEQDLEWVDYGGPRNSSTPWESGGPINNGPNPINDDGAFAATVQGAAVFVPEPVCVSIVVPVLGLLAVGRAARAWPGRA